MKDSNNYDCNGIVTVQTPGSPYPVCTNCNHVFEIRIESDEELSKRFVSTNMTHKDLQFYIDNGQFNTHYWEIFDTI